MLFAEGLLLLLTADDTGKLAADSTNTDTALGGALPTALAHTERVDIAGPDERVREGRLVVRDASPTRYSVLDEALATVGHKEGKSPRTWRPHSDADTAAALRALAEAGLLGAEEGRTLGIFPTYRWPAEHADHEAAVRASLVTALGHGVTTGLSKRELNAERIAEGGGGGGGRRTSAGARQGATSARSGPARWGGGRRRETWAGPCGTAGSW